MTNWLPQNLSGEGPLYIQIADAICADIDKGVLKPGEKLPPQRNIAFDIGVTIGTISRAYNRVIETGLATGEVGRGTYVRGGEGSNSASGNNANESPLALNTRRWEGPRSKLILLNSTGTIDVGQARIRDQLHRQITEQMPGQVSDYVRGVRQHWLQAGADWMENIHFRPDEDCIVPTMGAQAALSSILASIMHPGDRLVTEEYSYTVTSRAAELMGRRTVPCAIDEFGMIPEALERICAQQHPTMIVLTPTFHNPTLSIMPRERREQIIAIAHRYNAWIVEDDSYGCKYDQAPPPFIALAPDRSFYVCSLSKQVDSGLRCGWAVCPQGHAGRVMSAHYLLSGGRPFILAELSAQMILAGYAEQINKKLNAECEARHQIVSQKLAGFDLASHPNCPYVWLHLPEPWYAAAFKEAALEKGLLIHQADEFKVTRTDSVQHNVRIAFTSLQTQEEVAHVFDVLKNLLSHQRAPEQMVN